MSLNKRDIKKNISVKAQIPYIESHVFLESFINILKKNINHKVVKIPKFGNFFMRMTPSRIGRNPKTKEEFKILKRKKIFFKASNKVKNLLNHY